MGNLFVVCYMPQISEQLKTFIKNNVSPSLEGEDSSQYHFDYINEQVNEENFILTDNDKNFFKFAIENNVEYLEF